MEVNLDSVEHRVVRCRDVAHRSISMASGLRGCALCWQQYDVLYSIFPAARARPITSAYYDRLQRLVRSHPSGAVEYTEGSRLLQQAIREFRSKYHEHFGGNLNRDALVSIYTLIRDELSKMRLPELRLRLKLQGLIRSDFIDKLCDPDHDLQDLRTHLRDLKHEIEVCSHSHSMPK